MPIVDPKDRKYIVFGLNVASNFAIIIALPVVLFVAIGRWIDSRQNTSPRYTILAFLFAAVVSGHGVYRRAKEYGKKYESLLKSEQKTD